MPNPEPVVGKVLGDAVVGGGIVLIDKATGEYVQPDPVTAQRMLMEGTHELTEGQGTIAVVSPKGQAGTVPAESLRAAFDKGFILEAPEETDARAKEERLEEKYGDAIVAPAALGALRGLTLGGSDYLARKMGAGDAVREYRERNPGMSIGGEIVGAVAPALLSGGATVPASGAKVAGTLAKAGRALSYTPAGAAVRLAEKAGRGLKAAQTAPKALGLGAEGAGGVLLRSRTPGLLGRAAPLAAEGAVEGAFFGAGGGLSNVMLSEDPIHAETVLAEMGTGALIGTGLGAGIGLAGGLLREGLSKAKEAARARGAAASDELAEMARSGKEAALRKVTEAQEEMARIEQKEAMVARKAELGQMKAAEKARLAEELKVQKAELGKTIQRLEAEKKGWEGQAKVALNQQQRGVKATAEVVSEQPVISTDGVNYGRIRDELYTITSDGQWARSMAQKIHHSIDIAEDSVTMARWQRLSRAMDDFEEIGTSSGKVDTKRVRGALGVDDAAQRSRKEPLRRVMLEGELLDLAKADPRRLTQIFDAADEVRLATSELIDDDLFREGFGTWAPRASDVLEDLDPRKLYKPPSPDATLPTPKAPRQPKTQYAIEAERIAKKLEDVQLKLKGLPKTITSKQLDDILAEEAHLAELGRKMASEKKLADQAKKIVKEGEKAGITFTPEDMRKAMQEAAVTPTLLLAEELAPVEDIPVVGSALDWMLKAHIVLRRIGRPGLQGATVEVAEQATKGPVKAGGLSNMQKTVKGALQRTLWYRIRSGLGGKAGNAQALAANFAASFGSTKLAGLVAGTAKKATFRSAEDVLTTTVQRSERAQRRIGRYLKAGKTARKVTVPAAVTILNSTRFGDEGKGKSLQEAYEKRAKEISALMADPNLGDKMLANLEGLARQDLKAADQVMTRMRMKLSYLHEKMPKAPGMGPLGMKRTYRPPVALIAKWARHIRAADDPLSVLEDLQAGRLTHEAADTLKVVYPEHFARMQQMVIEQAAEMQSLPYAKRLQLSHFTDVPIDPSMRPDRVQNMQIRYEVEETQKPASKLASIKAPEPTPAQRLQD